MKKTFWATGLLLFILFPALMAQGAPIKKLDPVPATPKIRVRGLVHYGPDVSGKSFNVSALIHLTRSGTPLTGVIVRIQDTTLDDQGDGSYRGHIWHYKRGLGDTLSLSVEFPRSSIPGAVPTMYAGRMKMAEITITNTVEWLSPVQDQVIDLPAYPSGVPVRWNFTGTLGADAQFSLKCDHRTVFSINVSGAELTIPAGTMLPGKLYLFYLGDEYHYFKVSDAFDPSSSVKFGLSSIVHARTQSAVK